MTEAKPKITVALLAGGKSSRMKKNKALLTLNGKSFIEHLIEEFICFDEILLSVQKTNDEWWKSLVGAYTTSHSKLKIISDKKSDCGPIEGLRKALFEAKNEFVFVCACDMPFASKKIPEYLEDFFSSDYECYVPVLEEKCEPLCAVYKKSILPLVENQIEKMDLKLLSLFEKASTKFIPIEKSSLEKKYFMNVNTPQEYNALQKPYVFCVAGLKNSGKTRMVCLLLDEAKRRGFSCAVIKHDGHDCFSDSNGSDTYNFSEHGAIATSVFSANRFMFFANEKTDVRTLIENIKSLSNSPDFIIIEGLKTSDFPKIEVLRSGICEKSECKEPVIFCAKDNYNIEDIFDSIEAYFVRQKK